VVVRAEECKEFRDVLLLACYIFRVTNTKTLVTEVLTKADKVWS